MMYFSCRVLILAVFLSVAVVLAVSAEQFEYKDYVVKPGDTLWDITKSELEDAFQWPVVWKENLRINNPDLIYPGQVIKVPVRLIPQDVEKLAPTVEVTKEAPEDAVEALLPGEVRKIEVKKAEVLVSREVILQSGYITWNVPDEGRITGTPRNEKMLYGLDDTIYVDTRDEVEPGKKFYVLRRENMVVHPYTDKKLGYHVRVLGTIEVTEGGRRGLKARVIESLDSMTLGDTLDHYYDVVPPFKGRKPRRPQLDAVVLTSRFLRELNGDYDMVFIDKGKNHDLREGDLLMVLVRGTDDTKNSVVQLVNLRGTTSMGLILESGSEVKRGDMVEGIK
jgi:LysM repeat protein